MRISRAKFVVLLAFSTIGLASSAFVLWTWNIERHVLPACTFGQSFFGLRFDCVKVLGSPYSIIFGIPLEVFATVYFVVNMALVWFYAFGSDSIARRSLRALFGWRFLGIVLVPYLVFVEVVLLRAICLYCTIMHTAIIADFVVITYLLFWKRASSSSPLPHADESTTSE
jgi:uncharacterized membrane protein